MKRKMKDPTNYDITAGDRVMIQLKGWKFREVEKKGDTLGVIINRQFIKLEDIASVTLTGASKFLKWHKGYTKSRAF